MGTTEWRPTSVSAVYTVENHPPTNRGCESMQTAVRNMAHPEHQNANKMDYDGRILPHRITNINAIKKLSKSLIF
jgi:hypothetical protein